jgi:hypothetical protein
MIVDLGYAFEALAIAIVIGVFVWFVKTRGEVE